MTLFDGTNILSWPPFSFFPTDELDVDDYHVRPQITERDVPPEFPVVDSFTEHPVCEGCGAANLSKEGDYCIECRLFSSNSRP